MNATACARIVALATLGLALSACKEDPAKVAQLEEQQLEVSAVTTQLKREVAKLKTDLGVQAKRLESARSDMETYAAASKDLAAQLIDMQKAFAGYKAEYRKSIRGRAPGMALGDTTLAGSYFKKVAIRTVTDQEMVFSHAGGVARVMMKDLGSDLQELLAWDPIAAAQEVKKTVAAAGNISVPVLPKAQTLASAPAAGQQPMPASSAGSGQQVTNADGTIVEMITLGADHGSGSHVKGAGSPVDPAYKPIGSSFTGSVMDRIYGNPANKKK
jgi:hypothetical protein